MKDRIAAGLISGIVAGIAMNIIDYTIFSLNFHQEHLYDWGASSFK